MSFNENGHIHLDLPVVRTSHCCNINLISESISTLKNVVWKWPKKKSCSYLQEKSNVVVHPLHMSCSWKGTLFIISYFLFLCKANKKKITFCTNWTNMSKLARVTFAKHPAKVFALSHWKMSNICAKQAVKLSFVQVQLICWCSG